MENKQLVYGVGINDVKYSENTKYQKEYALWTDMIRRCYCEKYLNKYPTYRNVKIVSEWFTYSSFKKDILNIKNFDKLSEGWVLDKDICSEDKLYSKETCCIVPQQVNIFFSTFSVEHNPAYDKRHGVFYCYCTYKGVKEYLGRFNTKRDSHIVYLKRKSEVIDDMIATYLGVLDDRVIHELRRLKGVVDGQVRLL